MVLRSRSCPAPQMLPVVALRAPQPLSGPWSGWSCRCLSLLRLGLWISLLQLALGWLSKAKRWGAQDSCAPLTPACLHPLPGVRVSIPKTETFLTFKENILQKCSPLSPSPGQGPRRVQDALSLSQRAFSSPPWKDGFLSLLAQFLHLKTQCTVVFYGAELRCSGVLKARTPVNAEGGGSLRALLGRWGASRQRQGNPPQWGVVMRALPSQLSAWTGCLRSVCSYPWG